MEPIISPWWIYFANVSENVSIILLAISIVSIILLGIIIALTIGVTEKFDIVTKNSKLIIRLIVVLISMMILGCAFPSKNTVYQMIAANLITEQRLTQFVRAGKLVKNELKSDLIDIIRSIGQDKTEEKKE